LDDTMTFWTITDSRQPSSSNYTYPDASSTVILL
jgi:hypothetical protein